MTKSLIEDAPLICLEWDKAAELVAGAQKIVVVTHVQPDGDAIGSMMGLTTALREQGKTVLPVVDGGMPRGFAFVPGSETIRDNVKDFAPDLVISTDASDRSRIGDVGESALSYGTPLIQLDHHQTNLMFGDVNLVDARTVAAAEGVLDWLDQQGWPLSPDVAQCLLTGLVTDTLCFRTSNVTGTVLGKAQRLMLAGADLAAVVQRTVVRKSAKLMRLHGEVLSRIVLEDGVIWATVTAEDFRAAGMDVGAYTGLSSDLIQAEEAVISVTFTEMGDDRIDVSMRSVPGFNVSGIALELGGGGHVQASGCGLTGMTIQESIDLVLPKLKAEAARGAPIYT
jgi:phosphoesterase RecJ-like protein